MIIEAMWLDELEAWACFLAAIELDDCSDLWAAMNAVGEMGGGLDKTLAVA